MGNKDWTMAKTWRQRQSMRFESCMDKACMGSFHIVSLPIWPNKLSIVL